MTCAHPVQHRVLQRSHRRLAVEELAPVTEVLDSAGVLKIIHNASFELSVFCKLSIGIRNIFDTLPTSRRLCGSKASGGHSLGVVCERELGKPFDKTEETLDRKRRRLSRRQVAYAAMDVKVLLPLYNRFQGEMLVS